ncbi:MAG: S26 family signal peptidase, partial [Phycisphaeraceae bacterium]
MAQQSSQNTTAKPRSEESTKEVFESIIIALILAFVFRAYVVEAFIIPTGSMAPTLLGAHAEIVCQQCGYRFTTDWPTSRPAILGRPHEAICPMCRFNNPLPAGSVPRAGDRILVQKYLYSFQEPERWDVMVFKYPEDPQNFNYIKRLVGLPNEQLYIFEGNLFVRPLDPDTGEPAGPWRIARKAERPEAQRAVWQPVYHSQYVPLDEGRTGAGPRRWNWSVPWRPVRAAEAWDLENQRQYRYAGDGRGTLRYRFRQPGGRQGLGSSGWAAGFMGRMFPYNQFKKNRPSAGTIEEIRLAATIVPEQTGTTAALATTARLEGAPETITASIDASGTLRLTARDGERLLGEYDASPLEAGRGSRLELWYVDHTLMVWFDGDPVIEHRVDLTLDELIARPSDA